MTDIEINSEIDKIIAERYNGYRGVMFQDTKKLHGVIRNLKGDNEFLELLKQMEIENPRPKFEMPPMNFKGLQAFPLPPAFDKSNFKAINSED